MLLRAVGRQAVAVIGQNTAIRSISVSRLALGGHGHHHEPQPVYIPKPGSLDWTFFSSSKKAEHEFEPYQPDVGSFVGAALFIGLTVAAVLLKTDTFKKDDKHHHQHHEEHKSVAESQPEPVEKEEVPVVEIATTSEEKEPEVQPEPVATSSESHVEEVETPVKAAEPEEPIPSTSSEEKPSQESETSSESESKPENALHSEYVIIGSGTAAYYASLAIRAKQAEAKVLMIGEESELPYNRPPLSKELWWYGDETAANKLDYTSLSGKKRDIFYEVEGFFVSPEDLPKAIHGGVSLIRGKRAVKLCVDDKKVILEDGSTVGFDKVLIATGVRPKNEKVFEEASEEAKKMITYYHYPADFKRVERGISDKSVQKITIVGNGLLASELAYSIRRKYENVQVSQVFDEKFAVQDILPTHLAQKSTEAIRKSGVEVHVENAVTAVRKCCKNVVVTLKNGTEVRSDLVIVATGEEPNTDILEASGLKVDQVHGGIGADRHLKVADNVWAAGAIVAFDDQVLGKRRISSWEHAQISGRLAGENMATAGSTEKAFWYQPSFFTKFAPNLHINGVGNCDSSLETVTVYAEPNPETPLEKAVIFYKSKEDGSIVGVLLLNVFGPSLDVARRIIDDRKKVDEYKEVAKLFPLYEMPKSDEETKDKSA